jgi:hypothetical protein
VFLGGDDIEVSHPESMFKFVLTKYNNSLINKTIEAGISTPYKLQLFTKTNVHVANLCVILKDTPVLDQVLAVSMFVRTGDEDYILERANWSAITDDEDTLLEIGLEVFSHKPQQSYISMIKLVKKVNDTHWRKLKSRTPINIGLSKQQHEMLMKGPREALTNIKEGRGIPKDWYTLMFRTEATCRVAKHNYTEETVAELTEVRNLCLVLKDRYIHERKFYLTEAEMEHMELGLDAADTVQLDSIRRIQLDAYKEADIYTRQIAQQIEKEIEGQEVCTT